MSLIIDHEQLLELMHDFHTLTGIRIVIFDDESREILTYPTQHCDLCKIIREKVERYEECVASNRKSFEECKQTGSLVIYKCHAGLLEATVAIRANGVIVGYVMFGQITDLNDKDSLAEKIIKHFHIDIDENDKWYQAAKAIKTKSFSQVKAAAKILEACTYYVLQKELIALKNERSIDRINSYIDEHLSENISAADLAHKHGISRTKLYEIVQEHLGMGIAEYIRRKRMEKARTLLISSSLSISQTAAALGYDDYTYFSKVFKKEFKMSPRNYRNKYTEPSEI